MRLLSYCKNLRIAYCQGNQLVPKELSFLPKLICLQKLDLSENKIIKLPEKENILELSQLTNLISSHE